MQSINIEFPFDPVPLDSIFYIERPLVEQLIYQEIVKPGCILRVQAPQKMGKTSLALRLMDYAKKIGYRTVYLDFQLAEEAVLTSLNKFLRWICANISYKLQLVPMLDMYWNEDIGLKMSCTLYLQNYIFKQIDTPLVLVFNEINRLFEYPYIAHEFLPLLHSWHEEAKHDMALQKLRLVVFQSSELYLTSFYLGFMIKLPEFNLAQIQELAKRHGLDWTNDVEKQNAMFLQQMVGGHPYLVRLALYYLVQLPNTSLKKLLTEASTISGIYKSHLLEHLVTLQKNSELGKAFKRVISTPNGAVLDHIVAYKLESMGLVKLDNNKCYVSCNLYREYFASQNLEAQNLVEQIVQLQEENQQLQHLSSIDDLTQLTNRRYFDIYLEQQWKKLAGAMAPLSLILLDIDHFKSYNDVCGHVAGDSCLRQIAAAIRNSVKRSTDLVARYGGEEFGVILPNTTAAMAFIIAEIIREEVENLGIVYNKHSDGIPDSIVTLSLGIACAIPNFKDSPSILVAAADQALYQSKNKGRNQTSVSPTLYYG
jgi:diguanylate cyclase (GGDEF)-like protein